MRPNGQAPPFDISQPKPASAKLPLQEPVLGDEVGDCVPLPAFKPAGQSQ